MDQFHARYLVLRAARAQRYLELNRPPFREVFRDETAVIYALN